MSTEKALALVLRTTDWSESSRIATLWTRELGKVRALAKGGRRLRSAFDSALDLLTVCSIVLIRKSSGSLDLLTEAQVAVEIRLKSEQRERTLAAEFDEQLADDLQYARAQGRAIELCCGCGHRFSAGNLRRSA